MSPVIATAYRTQLPLFDRSYHLMDDSYHLIDHGYQGCVTKKVRTMLKNNSIDSKLLVSRVAIENGQTNATIAALLADYGYDGTKMTEGQTLLEDAESKQATQKKEYGEQFDATDELDAAMSAANKTYMRHVKIARIAFKTDRGAQSALQLTGRRRQTYSGWLQQARVFYKNAIDDAAIKSELAGFGINGASLNSASNAVEEVGTKLAAQLKEKGEAQEATDTRDQALEALLDWRSDYFAIARIALEEEAQLLEVLGIVEPS